METNEKGGYYNNRFFHFNMVLDNENSSNSCFRHSRISILVKVKKKYKLLLWNGTFAHSIKECMLKYFPIFTL